MCVCADIDGPKIIIIVVSSTHTLELTASNCNDVRERQKSVSRKDDNQIFIVSNA